MQTIKTTAIAVFVAFVIAIGVSAFAISQIHPTVQPVQAGAVSPDIPSPYFSYGGVLHWAGMESFVQGTSTLCAIQSPAATTTLGSITARFDTQSAYTMLYEIGKATTPYATTTLLARMTLATNSLGFIVGTTSATALQDGILPPNSWLVLKAGTSSVGSDFLPQGSCSATFRQI